MRRISDVLLDLIEKELLHFASFLIKSLDEVETWVDSNFGFDDDFLRKNNTFIFAVSNSRHYDLENLLNSHTICFYWDLREEGFFYAFPNVLITYDFSAEKAFATFQNFIDENENTLDDLLFPQRAFDQLKEEHLIPSNYDVLFALRHPEESTISHCLVCKGKKVIHFDYVDNIIKVVSHSHHIAYIDLDKLENWAKIVFDCIEKEEKEEENATL